MSWGKYQLKKIIQIIIQLNFGFLEMLSVQTNSDFNPWTRYDCHCMHRLYKGYTYFNHNKVYWNIEKKCEYILDSEWSVRAIDFYNDV